MLEAARASEWRRTQDLQARIAAAWYTERFARSKKLPQLGRVLRRIGRQRSRQQTPRELASAARAWVEARRSWDASQAARAAAAPRPRGPREG